MRVRAPSVSCCRGNATPAQLHHSATQFYIICIVVHPRHLHDMMSLRVHSIISDDATQGTLQHHPTEWFDWHIYTCAGRSALLWMMHPLISPRRRPHFELNSCFEEKKGEPPRYNHVSGGDLAAFTRVAFRHRMCV